MKHLKVTLLALESELLGSLLAPLDYFEPSFALLWAPLDAKEMRKKKTLEKWKSMVSKTEVGGTGTTALAGW